MALYMMFGKYTRTSVSEINSSRTKETVGVIEKANGQVVSMYAMLGNYDVVLIVNLPGNREAMEVSVGLSKVTGIQFTTGPIIPIDRFDEMIELQIADSQTKPIDLTPPDEENENYH